jgi:hypothetical protein
MSRDPAHPAAAKKSPNPTHTQSRRDAAEPDRSIPVDETAGRIRTSGLRKGTIPTENEGACRDPQSRDIRGYRRNPRNPCRTAWPASRTGRVSQ